MLYLEDFLELIEQLPGELRDRSTEMRMLDLQVQQLHEQANKERDEFFETGGTLPVDMKLKRYKEIMDLYDRAQALTDEKVAIADISHTLLTKYTQKLNKEILHFKLELEADNPGITEQIERKFNETERNLYLQRKERRRRFREVTTGSAAVTNGNLRTLSETMTLGLLRAQKGRLGDSIESGVEQSSQVQQVINRSTVPAAGAFEEEVGLSSSRGRNTVVERDPDLPPLKVIVKRSLISPHKILGVSSVHPSPAIHPQLTTSASDRADGWSGVSNPASVASSQLQFSLHSSKSTPSYTNTSASTSGHSAPGPPMMSLAVHESRHGRPRKLTSRAQEMLYTMQRHERRAASHHSRSPEPVQASDDDSDSDRRVWCFCREKAYGSMVACDDRTCPFEWFHYECVNISEKPKGKWYCPQCASKHAGPEMPVPNRL